jgi:hypothetical protein
MYWNVPRIVPRTVIAGAMVVADAGGSGVAAPPSFAKPKSSATTDEERSDLFSLGNEQSASDQRNGARKAASLRRGLDGQAARADGGHG